VIEVKTTKRILIINVAQLLCNTMFSIHTILCSCFMFEYLATVLHNTNHDLTWRVV